MTSSLLQTRDDKPAAVLRVLAGAPLFFFGLMHLIGAMPMAPILEAAGLPTFLAIPASLAQALAGLLLLGGLFARVGAALAIGTMIGAIITHIQIPDDRWPDPANPGAFTDEPVIMIGLALLIALASGYVALRGGGSWSLDKKRST